ncbi:hypothetical protein P3S67_027382 [Capsicum chacoense]
MKKGISPKFSSHSHDYNSNSHFMCHGTVVVQPSGKIKGIKPPPQECKIGYESECCKPGESYTTYKCSPSVSGKTKVVLTINSWFSGEKRCMKNITVYGNERQTDAMVVNECDSTMDVMMFMIINHQVTTTLSMRPKLFGRPWECLTLCLDRGLP